jgi:hypothetical protein
MIIEDIHEMEKAPVCKYCNTPLLANEGHVLYRAPESPWAPLVYAIHICHNCFVTYFKG